MPAPASPNPRFPWEDDEEAPGLSIRPLSPADLQAFVAEWDDAEEPLRLPPVARPQGPPRHWSRLARPRSAGQGGRRSANTGAGAPPNSLPGPLPSHCGWPQPSPLASPSGW